MLGRKQLTVALIVIALIAGVMAPVLYSGFADLRSAQSANKVGRYSDAMHYYTTAARLLFWRNDLWVRAGWAAYHNGDSEEALRLLEIARQKEMLSAQDWDLLGSLYWAKGNNSNALSVWETGSHSNPSFPPLLDRLSNAYHSQRDYASEQSTLDRRVALGQDAAAYYHLGLIMSLSNSPEAQKELSDASSLDADFTSAARTLITTLNIAAGEPDRAQQLIIIGRGLGLVEEWGLASVAFEQATQADNSNAEAWAWLGEASQHIGGSGIADLDKALSLDSRDAVVLGLRGLYWKRQGQYAQALAEYRLASHYDPTNAAWQSALGDAFSWNGDLVSALAAYQAATSLAPNEASNWRLLAMFCADHGVQVQDIGLPAAKMAVQLAPADPTALDALGWSYMNAGYLYNAEQTLLKAVQVAPDLPLTRIHLAELYMRKGDNISAFNELIRARQLDPTGAAGQMASQLLQQYFP